MTSRMRLERETPTVRTENRDGVTALEANRWSRLSESSLSSGRRRRKSDEISLVEEWMSTENTAVVAS